MHPIVLHLGVRLFIVGVALTFVLIGTVGPLLKKVAVRNGR